MTKYFIALLVVIAVIAGLLVYIGDDVFLNISSTAKTSHLAFAPITLSWQKAIAFGALGFFGLLGVWSGILWLVSLPRRVKSGVGLRRRNQALDAMEEALIAGAEGDVKTARKKAEKARELIGSPDLGRIISAQAAEACGDSEEALAQYKAMLKSEKTRVSAQRGLAQNMLATGNLPGAIEQAQMAYSAEKNARWAFDTLFKAQVADHRWLDALETLKTGEGRKHIGKDASRRRQAVLLTAEADRLHDDGEMDAALNYAGQAIAASPSFAPGAALAAKLWTGAGQAKKAASAIEKAWALSPHPALALAYRDIFADGPAKTLSKKLASLRAKNETHRESVLLGVEEDLRSGNAVSAWSVLSPLVSGPEATPSARLCLLAAQAETQLENKNDANVWVQRAATAPREADWSDLDPSGDSFDYTAQDWRRLVFSYGDTGELIHPRAEKQAAARLPGLGDLGGASAETTALVNDADKKDGDDLAGRLDSLLD